MSMLVIFDHHKNTLMENLKAAGDAGQIRQVISDCFDRMLAEHNEALSDPDSSSNRAQLGLAAALVAQAKTSVRFLDSTGEPVVWEKRSSSSSGSGVSKKAGSMQSLSRLSKTGIGAIGAGLLVFWLFLVLKLLSPASLSAALQMLLPALLMTALSALGVWLLIRGTRTSDPADRQYMAQITYDRDKILGHMRALVITIDQCMDDMEPLLNGSGEYDGDMDASGLPEDELRLLSDLLEAGCSKDGQIALEAISRVRYYLHRKGIEVVDYSADKRRWFEMMPAADDSLSGNDLENEPLSDADHTLRPALVRDQVVLRKGLAC